MCASGACVTSASIYTGGAIGDEAVIFIAACPCPHVPTKDKLREMLYAPPARESLQCRSVPEVQSVAV